MGAKFFWKRVFRRRVVSLTLFLLSFFLLSKNLTTNQNPKGSSRVWLLATDGPAGQAALGDAIDPLTDREKVEIVGWARFEKLKEKVYSSAAEVEADSDEHLVGKASADDSSSIYGWREGVSEALFGWSVAEFQRAGQQTGGKQLVLGRRLLRSVYLLERAPSEVE